MKTIIKTDWTWIINENSKIDINTIIGKYLFFSDNKETLIRLAKILLTKFDFPKAKVPTSDILNNSKGFGFVLCIYSHNNNLKYLLKDYEINSVNYRYFKTDKATRQGKYSKQYLNSKA